jgi:CheY-like chemotaxis protein
LKVLVIDDEPAIREICGEFLCLLGYEVDVAENGREGLAHFDPLVHQIVVTDFLMPGLTGAETAAAIRARSGTTQILLISGSVGQHDENLAVEAGWHFLRKPFAFEDFEAALAEIAESVEAAP